LQYLTYSSQNPALVFPHWLGWKVQHLSGNGDLNLNTSLDVDDDLLDDLSGGVKVDQALVDSTIAILSAKSSSNPKQKHSQAMQFSRKRISQEPQFPAISFKCIITHLIS
jgi:hypothetical protein